MIVISLILLKKKYKRKLNIIKISLKFIYFEVIKYLYEREK